ncbi:tubby C-terminal domain-like protein [Aquibacillus kalidii]|uniref:tubby C-terminal domain-like protein n=1 Tax=Aquibacillus kalidii TaxID=2762597 RepID=UPI001648A364|nr:hypothetical protein [Aquibacillus kalidii]
MTKLLVLFLAGFVGLSLRYIVYGEFNVNQLYLLLMFPIGALLAIFIMRSQYNKDRDFKPEEKDTYLVTRLGDRVSEAPKQLYNHNVHIGSFHRFYTSRWKRLVADTMGKPGQWYLNLSFSLSNGDEFLFRGKKENKLRGNNEWTLYMNEVEVGTVRTDYSLKNASKLKESLYLDYHGDSFHFKSLGIGSKTEISLDDVTVATGKRTRNSVYQLVVNETHATIAPILFMVYILFNYEFGQ